LNDHTKLNSEVFKLISCENLEKQQLVYCLLCVCYKIQPPQIPQNYLSEQIRFMKSERFSSECK